jgi:flagellar hook assembly protein FlgD
MDVIKGVMDKLAVTAKLRLITVRTFMKPFSIRQDGSSTTIEYSTERDGHAVLEIYSLGGQRLRTLVNGLHPVGRHQAYWNGEDDQGRPVSSGMYLIRLQTASQVRHHKVTLIK